MSGGASRPVKAPSLLDHNVSRKVPNKKKKEQKDMNLRFHLDSKQVYFRNPVIRVREGLGLKRQSDDNVYFGLNLLSRLQTLKLKTSKWQSDFTTEVTIAPSQFRHRDFADEKYLKRFNLCFHVDNAQAIQTKTAKNQSDLRQTRTPPQSPEKFKSLRLCFKPLDKEEEMGTEHTKAYMKGVNREWIDPRKQLVQDRNLRMTFPELMQAYEPKPVTFLRNFRSLKTSDTNEVLGEYIDPKPCIGIDRVPEEQKTDGKKN